MIKMKKIIVWLMLVVTIGLCACGKKEETPDTNLLGEYVYVPEFIPMELENVNTYNSVMRGEDLYFTSYSYDEETQSGENRLVKWNVKSTSNELETLPISFAIEGKQGDLSCMAFDNDGNLYAVICAYPIVDENFDYENYTVEFYLCKYDANYNLLSQTDISKEMSKDQNNNYVQDMLIDNEGKIYLQCSNLVRVFGTDGKMEAEISVSGDWISVMGISKEGKVYIGEYNYTSTNAGFQLSELDVANNAIGAIYNDNMPNVRFAVPGVESGMIMAGDNAVFHYDFASNTLEKLFDWTDSNINGSSLENMQLLADGRIMVITRDYSSSTSQSEVAILTKTKASEVEDKEIITVASLYSNYELQQLIVNFNKSNPTYMIRNKVYIDDNVEWTETTYTDGITRLTNDLTSKNAPDIIDLSFTSGDLSNYTSKGLLEDLTPYLEKSANLNKDDFIEKILEAYTYDGKLVALARQFNLRTIWGKEKYFGAQDGFTVEDMFQIIEEYPDKKLFQDASKMGMFNRLVYLSFNEFIDYSNGTCDFESDRFREILECANTQKSMDYQYDPDVSLPEMLQTDQVLLNEVYISDMYSYSMYTMMFEEPSVLVGYPTSDGSKGVILECYNPYGIVASSKNKEGAWKFLETMYQYSPDENKGYYQFSSLKAEMEDMYNEAMEKEYMMDWATGELELDENGEPVERPKTSWGYDNWMVDIYASTQEQVDEVKALINMATPSRNYVDEKVSEIITEEVEPYFLGKKSVEETMDVIQRRVSLYLGENY